MTRDSEKYFIKEYLTLNNKSVLLSTQTKNTLLEKRGSFKEDGTKKRPAELESGIYN